MERGKRQGIATCESSSWRLTSVKVFSLHFNSKYHFEVGAALQSIANFAEAWLTLRLIGCKPNEQIQTAKNTEEAQRLQRRKGRRGAFGDGGTWQAILFPVGGRTYRLRELCRGLAASAVNPLNRPRELCGGFAAPAVNPLQTQGTNSKHKERRGGAKVAEAQRSQRPQRRRKGHRGASGNESTRQAILFPVGGRTYRLRELCGGIAASAVNLLHRLRELCGGFAAPAVNRLQTQRANPNRKERRGGAKVTEALPEMKVPGRQS